MQSFNREKVDCGASTHDAEKERLRPIESSRVKARWIHDSNDDIRQSAFFVTVLDVSLASLVSLGAFFSFSLRRWRASSLCSHASPRLASERCGKKATRGKSPRGGRYNHVARCLSSSSVFQPRRFLYRMSMAHQRQVRSIAIH